MTKPWKVIIWVAIAAVAIIGSWQLLANQQNKPKAPETIKIGIITPLTGDLANWGQSMRGGIEIAAKQWNDKGGINGKRIELIFEDNKSCDKAESITAFNKLTTIDGTKVVMAGCSGSVLAVAPIAEQNKILLLTPAGSAAKISQAGDYVFRTCISDAVQGKNLGEYMTTKLNINNAAVIYANNDYGVGFYNNFKTAYEAVGGKISDVESYETTATDFSTALTKIKEGNPQALVIISYGSEGGLIAKQARGLGINAQVIGSDNFGVKEVVQSADGAAEGSIFVTSALDDNNQKVKDLKASYQAMYHQDPAIMIATATAYDGTNLLIDAIRQGGYNPDNIKTDLYAVKNYDGVSGSITIDSNGDAQMPSTVQQVKNSQFVSAQ